MRGRWEVMKQCAGGLSFNRVYRLRDAGEVMHSGNIEFYETAGNLTKEEARELAERLNAEEEKQNDD